MSIRTRHTVSGVIAEVPENIANHVVLGRYLEPVPAAAKPYVPELHKPREARVEIEPVDIGDPIESSEDEA